jgi:hypothetical protein
MNLQLVAQFLVIGHTEVLGQILFDKHIQFFFCPATQSIFIEHPAHDVLSILEKFVKVDYEMGLATT